MSTLMPAVVFVAVGAMFVGLALPLITRRIPPNRLYGLRTHATLNDEWVWYEANARSARELLLLGVVLVVIAVVMPLALEISQPVYALAWAGLLVIGTLVVCLRGIAMANRLFRAGRGARHGG